MKKILLFTSIYFAITQTSFADNFAIKISEIMANPEGKDENNEWIELYNTSNEGLSLMGWKIIVDGEKDFTLNQTIQAKSHLIIRSKVALKNSQNTIKLKDQSLKLIDQVTYPKTKEGQSYSHLLIKNATEKKSTWQNGDPTPGSQNILLHELSGKITKSPNIGKNYYFEINNKQKIIFDHSEWSFPELENSLSPGSFVEIQAELIDGQFHMKEFRIKTLPSKIEESKKSSQMAALLIIISFCSLLLIKSPINHVS